MTREAKYDDLVRARKDYDPTPWGLKNPSALDGGRIDSDHIGPWTIWAHDLHADLMVVGQDWGDVRYFTRNGGVDNPGNPTNNALWTLLAHVGRPVPEPPTSPKAAEPERAKCRVWLTNALLWLKEGGMSARVDEAWFGEPAIPFLIAQIDIVQPRVVVALGQKAYSCLTSAYRAGQPVARYRDVVDSPDGLRISARDHAFALFGVYHCGARIRNTIRPLEHQHRDWDRIRDALVSTR